MTVSVAKAAIRPRDSRHPITQPFAPVVAQLFAICPSNRLDGQPARKRGTAERQPPALPSLVYARATP